MTSKGLQFSLRQILPLTILVLAQCSVAMGQLGEGGTDGPEPQVILPDHTHSVPVRTASKEITESTDPLVKLVWETREAQRRRLLSVQQHTPWQIMHGLLGLRQDFLINHNDKPINGLEWIYSGPTYMNESWFQKTPHGGRAHPFSKPYWFEGHINQFLAILSMCNVPLDQQFATPQGPITMRDMLKNAQMTVNAKEEVTWTLWALSTYLPPDATWVNAAGEQWSIEKLVQIETGKKVGGPTSPCGGTHGLFALARARNVYLRTGKPLRGVWLEADQKIKRYIDTAMRLRNNDGSLSSAFFRGKEFKQDFDKRMASEGHVLEFLMMAVSQEELKQPWVRKAIETTANDLMANRKAFVQCSPLYHATNALSIYLERVAPSGVPEMAKKTDAATSVSSSRNLGPASTQKPGPVPAVPQTLSTNKPATPAATPADATKSAAPSGGAKPQVTQPAPAVQSPAPAKADPKEVPAAQGSPIPAPTGAPPAQEEPQAAPSTTPAPAATTVPSQGAAPAPVPANALEKGGVKPSGEASPVPAVNPNPATASSSAATQPAFAEPASAAPALMPTPEPNGQAAPVLASQSPTVVLALPAEPMTSAPAIDTVAPPKGTSPGPVTDERFDRLVDIVVMPQPLSAVFRSVSLGGPSVIEAPKVPPIVSNEGEKAPATPSATGTPTGNLTVTPAPQPQPKPAQPQAAPRRTWRPSTRQGRSSGGFIRR